MIKSGHDLIITIVNKGWSSTVIEASQKAGARGATVFKGRGSGLKNVPSLFGIPLEPEKDIVLCAVPEEISEKVLLKISKSAALCKPGTGVSFILPIKGIVGIYQENTETCCAEVSCAIEEDKT